MSDVKERIIGAVTVMSDSDASHFWQLIADSFRSNPLEGVPEEAPDDIDLAMLEEIRTNPDCHEFVSQDEVMRILDLA